MSGLATACPGVEDQLIDVSARYTWNDRIDPNPLYTTDRIKSAFAELITLGGARPYDLAISWSTSCTIEHFPSAGFSVVHDGWPGLGG